MHIATTTTVSIMYRLYHFLVTLHLMNLSSDAITKTAKTGRFQLGIWNYTYVGLIQSVAVL